MKYETIKPYIEKRLISEQVHPEAPNVRIFNYTHACQFSQAWDEVTTQCRGLILNIDTGEVLARPFPKFFNLAEHQGETPKDFPIEIGDEPLIYEKYDGSLAILYWLHGRPWIATRGSFMSEQAMWATKWLRENINTNPLRTDHTHLFEIIWKPNRIVVNYDFEGLVYLSTVDIKTKLSWVEENMPAGLRMPKQIHHTDWQSLHQLAADNKEGFVLFFPKSNFRVKVKFDEYVRLHKILTGLSEKGVWEYLKEHGVNADLTAIAEDAPDEFYGWLRKVGAKIKMDYLSTLRLAQIEYKINFEEGLSRKELAQRFTKTTYPALLFAFLDNKDFEKMIWRMIEPKGKGSVVFKQDIDS